jgi:hypothetical protein
VVVVVLVVVVVVVVTICVVENDALCGSGAGDRLTVRTGGARRAVAKLPLPTSSLITVRGDMLTERNDCVPTIVEKTLVA